MALNVVMLGPPGAGKGTQAARIARERGVPKISTGDILRESIKEGLPVALAAKVKMDRGELVDDETMVAIVRERLSKADTGGGFVLDGFPRTVGQARALDQIIEGRGSGPLVIADIVVPEEEIVRRLASRRICAKCGTNADPFEANPEGACRRCGGEMVQRTDDGARIVLERLKVYHRDTKPLVEFYRERPTFRVVNGAQAPERVAHDLDAMIADASAVGGAVA